MRKRTSGLTKQQKTTLEKHKEHHTAKHMAFMRKEMKNGKRMKNYTETEVKISH